MQLKRGHAVEENKTAEIKLYKNLNIFEVIDDTIELQQDSQQYDEIIAALTMKVKTIHNTHQLSQEVD